MESIFHAVSRWPLLCSTDGVVEKTPCVKCQRLGRLRVEVVVKGKDVSLTYYCGHCDHTWQPLIHMGAAHGSTVRQFSGSDFGPDRTGRCEGACPGAERSDSSRRREGDQRKTYRCGKSSPHAPREPPAIAHRQGCLVVRKSPANESGKLAPVVTMRQALQTALTEAAGTVGKAGEYASGMKEYARAAKAGKLASEHLPAVIKAAGKATGVGAGGALGWKLFDR